jgi:hypothetical protein
VDSHWRGAARDSKSAFTRVHSPSKTGVNALNDALCVAAATVRTGMSGGLAHTRSRRLGHRGQRVVLVNMLFWKILVTRVKRKMR